MHERESFKCWGSRHTYTCVHIDFSLKVVTWTHVADAAVSLASLLQFFLQTFFFKHSRTSSFYH